MVFLIHTELRCTVNHTSDIKYCYWFYPDENYNRYSSGSSFRIFIISNFQYHSSSKHFNSIRHVISSHQRHVALELTGHNFKYGAVLISKFSFRISINWRNFYRYCFCPRTPTWEGILPQYTKPPANLKIKGLETLSVRSEQILIGTCQKFPVSKSRSMKYMLTLVTVAILGQDISCLLETLNESLSMNEAVQRVY